MVEPRAARAREGAGRVVLEASLVSFNGDGDWALGNGECKLILAVLRDVGERGEGGGVGAFLGVVASFVLFLVWVVCFGIEALVKLGKKNKTKKTFSEIVPSKKEKGNGRRLALGGQAEHTIPRMLEYSFSDMSAEE